MHLDADYEYSGYCYFLMGGIGLAFLVGTGLVLAGLMSMPWSRGSAAKRSGPARERSDEDEPPFKPKPKKRKRFRDDPDD